jgi:hypothetical protein
VLDFGCGAQAWAARELKPLCRRIDGVEPTVAAGVVHGIQVVNQLEELRKSDYEVVIALAVFEHLRPKDLQQVLHQLHAITVPEALVVGTVPTPLARPVLELLSYRFRLIDPSQIRDHKVYYDDLWLAEILNDTPWQLQALPHLSIRHEQLICSWKTMTRYAPIQSHDAQLIFTVAFLARLLWALFSGLGPENGADFDRYDTLSNNILVGDFNLETKLFIVAPLFPYALALAKLIFGANWFVGLGLIQILISSASVVCLAKAANLIFHKRTIAITAGLLYALCLPTIYYTHLPSQESLFQSLFVISFYWLCRYSSSPSSPALAGFSIAFTLALLTKSHVIIMVPLVLAFIILKRKEAIKALIDAVILFAIIGLLTLPYGLYNLSANGSYVISSSGSGGFFLTGHNDDFYQWLVNTPPKRNGRIQAISGHEIQSL